MRAYYRDISFKNIPNLGKFIEAELSNHFPASQYSWVFFNLKTGPFFIEACKFFETIFSINVHRAELIHFEGFVALADSLLDENRTALAVINFDDDSKEKRKPPEQSENKNTNTMSKARLNT